jgi:ribosomal protein L37AE/L43A
MARYRGTYRRYEDRTARHACPTCKRMALTDYEKARGYQCADCTRRAEAEF